MLKWLSCILQVTKSNFALIHTLLKCSCHDWLRLEILSKCWEDSDWRLCLCVCAQLRKRLCVEQSFCFESTSSAFAYIGYIIYSVSQKSSPPKTFCNIFTWARCISVKFCQFIASTYPHMLTSFGRFNLIFNKMALIFLGVLIVFTVSNFEF